jgi:hypothetical protein
MVFIYTYIGPPHRSSILFGRRENKSLQFIAGNAHICEPIGSVSVGTRLRAGLSDNRVSILGGDRFFSHRRVQTGQRSRFILGYSTIPLPLCTAWIYPPHPKKTRTKVIRPRIPITSHSVSAHQDAFQIFVFWHNLSHNSKVNLSLCLTN